MKPRNVGVAISAMGVVAICMLVFWPRPRYSHCDSPEAVATNFFIALFYRDWRELSTFVADVSSVEELKTLRGWAFGQRVDHVDDMKTDRLRPGDAVRIAGREVVIPASAITAAVVLVAVRFGGSVDVLPVRVQQVEGRWLVDADPLVHAAKAAKEASGPTVNNE